MARRVTGAGRAAGPLDAWERDLATLGATLQHPQLRRLMEHPAVPYAEKERVLRRVAGDALEPGAVSLGLLMVRRGRPGAIAPMVARFGELLCRERGLAPPPGRR